MGRILSICNLNGYKILLALSLFNYFCMSSGESMELYELLTTEDLRECSWCIKQIAKEIVIKAKELLPNGMEDDKVELRVTLTTKDLETLDQFANGEMRLEQVVSLFKQALYTHHPDEEAPHLQQGLSPSTIILISTGGITLCAMWMILSRHSVCLVSSLLLLLSFSVGITWNWWKLYNEEYSRRVTQIPDECKPEESSWYHSFKGFIVDPNCGDYFKAPVDDPVAMVSPGQVVMETISMLFVSPISMVMSSFSGFIQSLCGNLIWPLNWIVQILLTLFLLAASTIIIITVLAGMFNLDLKFSTFMLSGELKPSRISKNIQRKRHPRPKDLALFPAPPSPFR